MCCDLSGADHYGTVHFMDGFSDVEQLTLHEQGTGRAIEYLAPLRVHIPSGSGPFTALTSLLEILAARSME